MSMLEGSQPEDAAVLANRLLPEQDAERARRHRRILVAAGWTAFSIAMATPFVGASYETHVSLPAGMFRMAPNMYPPDTASQDQPHHTLTLPGTKYGAEWPRDKHFGTVIGVPAAEVTAWERAGCDYPVVGFQTDRGLVDGYSLHGMSELGTVKVNGQSYRALVKMAELTTNQVALGCASHVGGDVTWSPSTVNLSGGPLPFVDAQKMGVRGVI